MMSRSWLITLFLLSSLQPCLAQSGPRTVGDGTLFLYSPGRSEGYGIYSGDIGGGEIGTPLYSRHHRFGDSTGIGSSTLQTTSATSESMSSRVSSFAPVSGQEGLARPNLPSASALSGSPALSGFTVSPSTGLGGGLYNGLFTGSGLTSGYAESASPFSGQVSRSTSLFQDLDAVPSFSRHRGTHSVLPLSGAEDTSVLKKVEPQF